MKKGQALILIGILVIVVAIAAVYFTWFHSKGCEDIGCFNSGLEKCAKVAYIEETENAFWQYRISGKSGDYCKIYAKLLRMKEGTIDMAELEGQEMTCYPLYGTIKMPRQDLDRCHGMLKEGLQKIIINKLHNYITENLGEISEELKEAI